MKPVHEGGLFSAVVPQAAAGYRLEAYYPTGLAVTFDDPYRFEKVAGSKTRRAERRVAKRLAIRIGPWHRGRRRQLRTPSSASAARQFPDGSTELFDVVLGVVT